MQVLRREHEVDFATSEQEMLSRLKQKSYDAVALSVFTSLELREVLKTAIKIKRINPAIVTILGGHGVEKNARKLINANGIDMVVEGEGEILLPLMLEKLPANRNSAAVEKFDRNLVELTDRQRALLDDEALELLLDGSRYHSPLSDEDAAEITGATFRRTIEKTDEKIAIKVPVSNVITKSSRGKIFEAVSCENKTDEAYGKIKRSWEEEHAGAFPLSVEKVSCNLHSYPNNEELNSSADYPWDIVEAKKWRSISVYAQRGCNWGRCAYCAISTTQGRRLEVAKIIALLEESVRRGMRSVTFEDDQFLQNSRWVVQLCDGIVKRRLNECLSFGAMIRVDSVKDRRILHKLRAANFAKLQIGVESFVPEKIRYFNKTPAGKEQEYAAKAGEIIEACIEEGILPGIFIITTRPKKEGALGEVAEELLKVSETIKKVYENHDVVVTFGLNDMLMAYPRAPLLAKEKYKCMLAPLCVVEAKRGKKLAIETLEIPYVFEFGSMALANFVGNLRAIGKRRAAAPEIMNETLEHVGDAVLALRVSAEHLGSEIATAFEFLASVSEQPNIFNALLSNLKKHVKFGGKENAKRQLEALLVRGAISPKLVIETASQDAGLEALLSEIPPRLAKEREAVLAKYKLIEENVKFVQRGAAQEVNAHLAYAKKEAEAAEGTSAKERAKKVAEIKAKTEKLLVEIYPYYEARLALEQLLQWLAEFDAAVSR